MTRKQAMREVQKLHFTLIDLGLYLNNQPESREALKMYDRAKLRYLEAKKNFEDEYGPLDETGIKTERDGWSWNKGPWPWEGED